MADFSQPGNDGVAPFSISEWRRGTVYTVRPEILSPLVRGQEYRSTAIVRRRLPPDRELEDYGELYRRAAALVTGRAAAARCSSLAGEALHTWIRVHAWRTLEMGSHKSGFASVSISLLFPNDGQDKPAGEIPPTPGELLAPGGATPEMLSEQTGGGGILVVGEVYNDFDYALDAGPGMFSYGEYVASAEGIDFEPFAERAELCARRTGAVHDIIAREWYCTTHPDLAVVHLYYR